MTPPPDTTSLVERLGTLSDSVRLHMLRLLREHELSVGELARALQLPQSTVSRHLKLLHHVGWIAKRQAGTASLYRLHEQTLDPDAGALWAAVRDQLRTTPTFEDDDSRLHQLLAERRTDSSAFFGRLGGEWEQLRREMFGADFTTEALLGLVSHDWVIADLGCGTGDAAEQLAPHVGRIIAVDREPAMLEAARKRLASFENIEFRGGDLLELPLADGEIDAAMVILVLHHLPEPGDAVREIARTLKPGGVLLVVDMVAHDRETYRQTMGHQHLGFDESAVRRWAEQSGLEATRYRRLRPDAAGKGPGLFAATMRKP